MNNIAIIDSPIGCLEICTNSTALLSITFLNTLRNNIKLPKKKWHPVTTQAIKELNEYFYSGRKTFTLPFELNMPPFYQSVLNEVSKTKFGQTKSYQKIAVELKNHNATRAVGTANAKNPIPIIIPCHRVISSNRTLGGYSGGIDKKLFLLKHEHSNFFISN